MNRRRIYRNWWTNGAFHRPMKDKRSSPSPSHFYSKSCSLYFIPIKPIISRDNVINEFERLSSVSFTRHRSTGAATSNQQPATIWLMVISLLIVAPRHEQKPWTEIRFSNEKKNDRKLLLELSSSSSTTTHRWQTESTCISNSPVSTLFIYVWIRIILWRRMRSALMNCQTAIQSINNNCNICKT